MRKGREKILSGKLCECGCGRETYLITDTQRTQGLVRGEPHRFVKGHRMRSGRWYKGTRISSGRAKPIHLIQAEKALRKPLPINAEVHHFNGEKCGGPLIICQDHSYHALLHIRQKSFKATGDPHKRKCTFCKQWDDPENMAMLKNGYNFHHKECKTRHTLTKLSPTGELYNKVKSGDFNGVPMDYLSHIKSQYWLRRFPDTLKAINKELETRKRSHYHVEDKFGKVIE